MQIPPEVLALVDSTFLSRVPRELAEGLLRGGRRIEHAAGSTVARPVDRPGLSIVMSGVVRVYLQSAEHKQVTVHYARTGTALGLVHLFSERIHVHAQAVTPTTLWSLSSRQVLEATERNAQLGASIARECASLVAEALDSITLSSFGSVRQRVARHLLALSEPTPDDGPLCVDVTQKELADATGSVREVVARALKELTDEGMVERRGTRLFVVDAAALDAAASFPTASR
jgi:CRP/FNR family transcriptional regulator